MGHVTSPDREYELLQKRYDKMVTGAPESPAFLKILKLLFSPEEAKLAQRLPMKPTPLHVISKKVQIPVDELGDILTEMAGKGLVLDFEHKGRRYFLLPPVVIGFFEFVFMRARPDLPMKELAELFNEYMFQEDKFAHAVFKKQNQIGRALVREEALDQDHTEILDWERATHIVENASYHGLSLCACRHKAEHLGHACDAPQEVCLTLNNSGRTMVRNGISKEITKSEALSVLDQAKEAGLVQTGDNVQKEVGYMCNCCGCCCGMLNAIRRFDIKNAIVTSNYLMEVQDENCKGCGRCVKACPIDAIQLQELEGGGNGKPKKKAVVDETLCLGCGVCYSSCNLDAIHMRTREKRVLPPETAYDRIITMAIERGKLSDLLFEDPEKLSHRALGRILHVIEKSPPYKAAMAVAPLKSAFLNTLMKGVK